MRNNSCKRCSWTTTNRDSLACWNKFVQTCMRKKLAALMVIIFGPGILSWATGIRNPDGPTRPYNTNLHHHLRAASLVIFFELQSNAISLDRSFRQTNTLGSLKMFCSAIGSSSIFFSFFLSFHVFLIFCVFVEWMVNSAAIQSQHFSVAFRFSWTSLEPFP